MNIDMEPTNQQQQQLEEDNVEQVEPINEKDTTEDTDLNKDQVKKGKTAKQLDKLAEKWMKNCVKAASLPSMIEIFEPIVPDLIEEIKECHSQGEEYMMTEFKNLLVKIFKEKNLAEKQNTLDRLKKEAEGRARVETRIVPTPFQVTSGILYNAKEQELLRLEKLLEDTTKENYDLMNTIRLEEEETKVKQSKINSILEDFNKNVSTTKSISQDDLINAIHLMSINRTAINADIQANIPNK